MMQLKCTYWVIGYFQSLHSFYRELNEQERQLAELGDLNFDHPCKQIAPFRLILPTPVSSQLTSL